MTTLITPLPTPPTRQDSANFNDRADEFLEALPLFQQEANQLAVEANANSQAAASVSNVVKWVSGITYQEGAAVWSPITGGAYRRITSAGFGNTDPSLDITNYKAITGAQSIQYNPAGDGAVATTVEAKLRITASDAEAVSKQSTQPAYAAVAVNFTRTTIDRHAFEDWSTLATTDAGQGYASFDAKPTMTTTQNQDHLAGYQSRATYSGANNLTGYMHGYDTAMVHNGTGTIARVAGMFLRETAGSGPIGENYGILIDPITRGASNAGIFSGPGNYHYLGGTTGEVETGVIKAKALNFGVDTAGKEIVYGYGSAGQTNFGKHVFYDGKTTILATLGVPDGLAVAVAIQSTYTITPGRFTFAQLPNTENGATAYCTNGRKIGEAAGAGTGVPVYYSNGAWRTYSNDAVVTA